MIKIGRSRRLSHSRSPSLISFIRGFFLGATVVIGANASGSNVTELEELSEILETARIEMELPGLRAAARFSDATVVCAAAGLADREANVALDNVAPMPGGSTGKTFVAAVTMLLVEEGVLSLDDLISKWLEEEPWFDKLPNSRDIRIWHLLSHTAGLSDYPESRSYQIQSIWRAIRRGSIRFEPDELIRYTLRKRPLFPVGEGFRYTDIGYLVLGKVIEAATDRQYYDLLREKILDPLGLDQVVVQDQSILPEVVPGYMRGARNLRPDGSMKIDPSSEWTGGGVALNPTMLVEFLGALAEARVVTPGSFKKMREMGWRDPDSPEEYYGLGLFVHDDGAAIGHAGLWPGYRTHVMHFFATDTTVAIQTNRDGAVDTREVVRRVADFVGKHGTSNE
ncbi:MAG: beta-lactamase family protein [Gammaproteobacteria bacterium]|nr:beta-lactamase family protein [Gammaproteobacteria bacterium]